MDETIAESKYRIKFSLEIILFSPSIQSINPKGHNQLLFNVSLQFISPEMSDGTEFYLFSFFCPVHLSIDLCGPIESFWGESTNMNQNYGSSSTMMRLKINLLGLFSCLKSSFGSSSTGWVACTGVSAEEIILELVAWSQQEDEWVGAKETLDRFHTLMDDWEGGMVFMENALWIRSGTSVRLCKYPIAWIGGGAGESVKSWIVNCSLRGTTNLFTNTSSASVNMTSSLNSLPQRSWSSDLFDIFLVGNCHTWFPFLTCNEKKETFWLIHCSGFA